MKNLIIFFTLTLFFQLKNIEAAAQACDSVVTNYDQIRYDSTELWQSYLVNVDSFSNHLIRSSSRCYPNFSSPFGLQIFNYTTLLSRYIGQIIPFTHENTKENGIIP